MQAIAVDYKNLAGFNIAKVGCVDQVEGTRFRRQNVGVTQSTQTQRPESPRIPNSDHFVSGQEEHRVGPFNLSERVYNRSDQVGRSRPGYLVQNHFRV